MIKITHSQYLGIKYKALIEKSMSFFSLPSDVKKKLTFSNTISGYRDIGEEYSKDILNPDLNESFSLRICELNLFNNLENVSDLLSSMTELINILDKMAQDELNIIALSFGTRNEIKTSENSWLQINFYQPSVHSRKYLQDEHEDGHLLTILTANAKGLEYKIKDSFIEHSGGTPRIK
jgi:isopenicillin N synthase-like dioxygenase